MNMQIMKMEPERHQNDASTYSKLRPIDFGAVPAVLLIYFDSRSGRVPDSKAILGSIELRGRKSFILGVSPPFPVGFAVGGDR